MSAAPGGGNRDGGSSPPELKTDPPAPEVDSPAPKGDPLAAKPPPPPPPRKLSFSAEPPTIRYGSPEGFGGVWGRGRVGRAVGAGVRGWVGVEG